MKTHAEDAAAYCQELTRQHAKNFYYAFLSLPRPKREAIYAVYAFCRYSDDLADEGHDPAGQQAALHAWRQELHNCYAGKPTHIITRALQPVIETYAIPQHYFDELIDGVEMDLTVHRYATFSDLEQYCYRVASVVGLICIEIFGYSHPGVRGYARHLGIALQLTNIMRDVKEDAARGRIYIPLEDLHAFRYAETALLLQRYTAEFVDLMAYQAKRVTDYYHKAEACLLPGDRAGLIAPEIMAGIYRGTLRKMARRQYNVFRGRTSLSTGHKVLIALRIFLRIWIGAHLLRGGRVGLGGRSNTAGM